MGNVSQTDSSPGSLPHRGPGRPISLTHSCVHFSCTYCRRRKARPRFWKESEIDDLVADNLKRLVIDRELAELIVDMLRESQQEEQAKRNIERASLLTNAIAC